MLSHILNTSNIYELVCIEKIVENIKHVDMFRNSYGITSECYICHFSAYVQQTALSRHSKLQGITKNNPKSVGCVELDILLAQTTDKPDDTQVDTNILKYQLCHLHTGEVNHKGTTGKVEQKRHHLIISRTS